MQKRGKKTGSARQMKKSRRLKAVALIIGIAFCMGTLFMSVEELSMYYRLKERNAHDQQVLEQTREKKEKLEQTRVMLTNPEYLEIIARGRYHYSKPGEQIFVFPGDAQ